MLKSMLFKKLSQIQCRTEKVERTLPKGPTDSNTIDRLTQISQCCGATKAASVVPSGLRSPRPPTCSAAATSTGTVPACEAAAVVAVAEVVAVAVAAVAVAVVTAVASCPRAASHRAESLSPRSACSGQTFRRHLKKNGRD